MRARLIESDDGAHRVIKLVMFKLGGEERCIERQLNLRRESCKLKVHRRASCERRQLEELVEMM